MIRSLPPYRIGDHCKELQGYRGAVWRFRNNFDAKIILSFNTGIYCDFYDKVGNNWISIYGCEIIVRAGYAWNGCSPKKFILGRWIGTPDTQTNIIASLFHDALVQFINVPEFTLSKEQVDLIFYHIMEKRGFLLACQYYCAVVRFGKYEKTDGEYAKEVRPA